MSRSVRLRPWWPVACLSALVTGLALPSTARAQAVERALYATVLDGKGAPVTSVVPADLVVREDGVQREILRVTPATDPMQIAVLVDTSAALSPDVSQVRDALEPFIDKMAGTNEISIVEFGERPRVLADASTNAAQVKKGVGAIFAKDGAGAYLLEAILETSRGFQKREAPRPVIVVITTEGVEFSNLTYDRVLDALQASGAELNVLVLTRPGVNPDQSDEMRNRNVVIDRGTRETGGLRQNLVSSLGLKAVLDTLADQLLHQWHVVYGRPQSLIPPEHVTLEAARPGLTVRGTPVKPAKGA